MPNTLQVGIISDGKYGERAFQNIQEEFEAKWIIVPEIEPTIMIDDNLELNIPECDLYISYVRHPDIILEIAELNKPLILGILPGFGLYKQVKTINSRAIYTPSMCSLKGDTGIGVIDAFSASFGTPIYEVKINDKAIISNIALQRKSLCGSSIAGAKFLKNKELSRKNLEDFALHVCHECRAPRFGHTCDKEIAGLIHLVSLFEGISTYSNDLKDFRTSIINEYNKRTKQVNELLNMV